MVANIPNGMYANRLVIHDMINRKTETLDYDYGKEYSKMIHVEDNKKAFIQHGPHKGKRFSEVLAVGTGEINPLKESKALYYSPLARLNASQGA